MQLNNMLISLPKTKSCTMGTARLGSLQLSSVLTINSSARSASDSLPHSGGRVQSPLSAYRNQFGNSTSRRRNLRSPTSPYPC
jgi:hypothetical protein